MAPSDAPRIRERSALVWSERPRAATVSGMEWEPEAEARVKKAPFLIRPFIRRRMESAARARGLDKVTVALLDEVKAGEHPRE